MTVLITGSKGFIARNLLSHLSRWDGPKVITTDRNSTEEELLNKLAQADIVIHLAGENRPSDEAEYEKVNTGLTATIVDHLEKLGRPYKLLYSSSAQASHDNAYGISKRKAEEKIISTVKNGSSTIFRFPGIFGKWCKPNYNSVVATYCHKIAHNLPIEVRDPEYVLNLMYIDDVVHLLLNEIKPPVTFEKSVVFATLEPVYKMSLGDLALTIKSFKEGRSNFFLPMVGDDLQKKLYSTYLTYLKGDDFSYTPLLRTDERGSLFELFKSGGAGQIFVSCTRPGVTRGNHFHHTKTEKFCVVYGKGLIRFRHIDNNSVIEYPVDGNHPQIVDIPPGYTHNIKNIGETDMITLFWANEIFDPQRPDTFIENV